MIKFNLVTMKDGEINVEEKKDLSKMLSDVIEEKNIDLFNTLEEEREKHVDEVFRQRTERVKKTKLAPGFYLNNQNSEFHTWGTLPPLLYPCGVGEMMVCCMGELWAGPTDEGTGSSLESGCFVE